MSQGPVLLLVAHQIVASGMHGIAAFLACDHLCVVSLIGNASILTYRAHEEDVPPEGRRYSRSLHDSGERAVR